MSEKIKQLLHNVLEGNLLKEIEENYHVLKDCNLIEIGVSSVEYIGLLVELDVDKVERLPDLFTLAQLEEVLDDE